MKSNRNFSLFELSITQLCSVTYAALKGAKLFSTSGKQCFPVCFC